ncbi:MAG: hypothetical protein H6Q43_476 [Deltaproteobacteria bacterium]|nr:hypothetical protein [Deltaproteobacteria bacterium]
MNPFSHSHSRYFAESTSSKKKRKGVLFFSLLLFFRGVLSAAEAGSGACPSEYGKMLYECNPTHEKQLFIIGMGHRDALTGANGHRTAKIQAEVYKIGEWLIRQEGVELVLPEGFFKSPGGKKVSSPAPSDSEKKRSAESLDLKTLEAKLADKTAFLNAEILLKRNYPIILQQVEDKRCYDEVGSLMKKFFGGGCSPEEYARTKAELNSLQDKRTAVMLQKVPEIIDREYDEGRIKTRKAIFTIGLSHIPLLLKYLNDGGIRFSSPHAGNHNFQELNLQREKFRVSILIPKSLAGDPKILEIYNLARIVSGNSSSKTNNPFPLILSGFSSQ